MGLMDFLRPGRAAAPVPRAEPPLVAQAQPPVQSESQWKGAVTGMVLGGSPSRAGVRVSEATVLSLPATLQALRVLCGVFAMTPLHYFRRADNGRLRIDDDIAQLMGEAPNGFQTGFQFRELLAADLFLAGNSYSYISRDFGGRPRALTRLKTGTVTVAEYFDRADGITIFYDATLPDGSRERFPARDILHVAGMSRDGLQGLNPIAYMRDAFGAAIATADHAAKYWGSGARPSVALKSKEKIDPSSKAALRNDFKSVYGGPYGESVGVFDQGLDVSFLSHTNEEDQFLETRGFQVTELARIWGVPPHLIFDLSRSTNNNIEHQSLEFVTYHMGPIFARVEQAATRAFAAPGHYFEHLLDALVKGDLKSRMEAYWLQRQMGIANANELRARDNQPSIPGDAGSEYWRPGNMEIAGQPSPGAPAQTGA